MRFPACFLDYLSDHLCNYVLGLFMFVMFVMLITTGKPLFAAEIHLAVASNFLIPVREIAKIYEKETSNKLIISAGSTGMLYAQIINGAPFDIYLAADSREPERLEKQGYIVDGSRFTYALGKLALWDSKGKFQGKTFQAVLRTAGYKWLSIANPLTAPYGAAAISVLKRVKLYKKLKAKILRGENVTQAYQLVASGAADLGFVALSQLKNPDHVAAGSFWQIDDNLYKPIIQQAVLLKSSHKKIQAEKFIEYLQSSKGRTLISRFGYGLP